MMPPPYNFTEYFMLTDFEKLSIIYGEEERVGAFDLRRENQPSGPAVLTVCSA